MSLTACKMHAKTVKIVKRIMEGLLFWPLCFNVSLQYWIILQFVFSLLSKIEIRWMLIIHIFCVKSTAISLTLLQYKMHSQCIHQHTVWDWGPICQTKLKLIQIIDWSFIQKNLVNSYGINIFIESFESKFDRDDEFNLMNSIWLRGKMHVIRQWEC